MARLWVLSQIVCEVEIHVNVSRWVCLEKDIGKLGSCKVERSKARLILPPLIPSLRDYREETMFVQTKRKLIHWCISCRHFPPSSTQQRGCCRFVPRCRDSY